MAWVAGVEVVGSIPACGILAQMCECARNAFTHSLARNFLSVGLEHGSIFLQPGRLPISKTSQLGQHRLRPYRPENRGTRISIYRRPLSAT